MQLFSRNKTLKFPTESFMFHVRLKVIYIYTYYTYILMYILMCVCVLIFSMHLALRAIHTTMALW